LIFSFFLFNLNCHQGTGLDSQILQAPLLLPSPPDTSQWEKGIDAFPEAEGIVLYWLSNQERDLAGYKVYRSTERRGTYRLIGTAEGADTSYKDYDVEVRKRYFYYLRAFDREGRESPPSDTLDYMLVEKAFNLNNTLDPRPTFYWQVHYLPDQYVLKLFQTPGDRKIWISVVNTDYSGQSEQVVYNFDGRACEDSLQSGVVYRWRIDIIGPELNSGSESNWKYFILP